MHDPLLARALDLAKKWQDLANQNRSALFQKFQKRISGLLQFPQDKIFFMELLDQGLRIKNPRKAMETIRFLFKKRNPKVLLNFLEKILFQLLIILSRPWPRLAVSIIKQRLLTETAMVVIPRNKRVFEKYLSLRKKEGVRINLNHLGEAVLGENEALHRLRSYTADLRNPAVECISVKISSIFSQNNPLGPDHSQSILESRLSELFRIARDNLFTNREGKACSKSIHLDMEDYSSVLLAVNAFQGALERPEFKNFTASIALQSYLPDSFEVQRELTQWAQNRFLQGASPIKIRLVKGANLEMESMESRIRSWPCPIYATKAEVDANFKRMLRFALEKENIKAVNLGIASHNLFDLAYGYLLAKENDVLDCLSIEMLEGMADHYRYAIGQTFTNILLYAPTVEKKYFINSMAYLVRRLDESTAPENFMRYSFSMATNSAPWAREEKKFRDSFELIEKLPAQKFRKQNRLSEEFSFQQKSMVDRFTNEPDTDWSIPENRQWAKEIRKKCRKKSLDKILTIPLVIDGKEIIRSKGERECLDRSQADDNIVIARYTAGDAADISLLVSCAKNDGDGFRKLSLEQRLRILSGVAAEIRKARGDLIGIAAAETGKIFSETDMEISEAIDFAEFYPYAMRKLSRYQNLAMNGLGVGLVIPPWNFPVAIPAGGILASLAAGNCVIIKPSSDAVATAWLLCQCFWRSGISQKTLQFFPCEGKTIGQQLLRRTEIDFMILTGGTDTAMDILKSKPEGNLCAEAGGKNATIITEKADLDLAIKNVLHSAFSHSGQKCSATSLLILEKGVYQDQKFISQLKDAAESIPAGTPWEFENKVGPLIRPPGEALARALRENRADEYWLLAPKNMEDNPHIWKPAIKWNVAPGSFCFDTELFGPVLSVAPAANLADAVQMVNSTGYGLTSGLESLDEEEHAFWKDKIKAGNLYINRSTTGAMALRQPFGGMGKSAFGQGLKAGGLNYVTQFMDFNEISLPVKVELKGTYELMEQAGRWQREIEGGKWSEYSEDLKKSFSALHSYYYQWENEFSRERDYFQILGQDNIIRYLPLGRIVVRIHRDDSLFEILARCFASLVTGNKTSISVDKRSQCPALAFLTQGEGRAWLRDCKIIYQSDAELIAGIIQADRIRYAHPARVPDMVFQEAAVRGFHISRKPPLMEGRIELLHYVREQSISVNYHRYGNPGARGLKSIQGK